MHELAIAESLVDAVTDKLGDRRVRAVRLQIGALAGVSVDALRFSFDVATEDTSLAGAALLVEDVPGRAHCLACDADFGVPDLILLCPCGSSDVRLLAGEELKILSVEVC